MKKYVSILLLITIATFLFTGCYEESNLSKVEDNGTVVETNLGLTVFEQIEGNLFYDRVTGVVYIGNVSSSYGYIVYTPYYAPNGLPYSYDVETSTFKEIPFPTYTEPIEEESVVEDNTSENNVEDVSNGEQENE